MGVPRLSRVHPFPPPKLPAAHFLSQMLYFRSRIPICPLEAKSLVLPAGSLVELARGPMVGEQ